MLKSYIRSRHFYALKDIVFFILMSVIILWLSVKTMLPGISLFIIALSYYIANVLVPHFAETWSVHALETGFATVCETYMSDKKDITKVQYQISIHIYPKKYYIVDICEKIAKMYSISMYIISVILFIISLKTFF